MFNLEKVGSRENGRRNRVHRRPRDLHARYAEYRTYNMRLPT